MFNLVELKKSNHATSCGFKYNGITFSQNTFNLIPGLCAVDKKENVELIFKKLKSLNIKCSRMGAFKPRTSPYSFQGLGKNCLSYVFELAGKYDIKAICMEITHERQIENIYETLEALGRPTGVILQIGTRNAQNFELLKATGSQLTFPILFKRGFGISLEESLLAIEYIANAGNKNIIFCFRGVKTIFAHPHRNLVDFAQIGIIKRLTNMPVCVDPSHSVGIRDKSQDGIMDIFHAASQGIISGANAVLLDCHPQKETALVDGHQALTLDELEWFVEDCKISKEAYAKRVRLAEKISNLTMS